ncbi:MAG: acetyl-CoA decarbonylase/synthase complex subunit gamma, partial [Planctomycetota bacterium]
MALTGLQIQKLLPKTNCKECGCSTCLAFAMKLAAKKAALKECPYASEEAKQILGAAVEPPIKTIIVGTGENPFKLGGETVLYRHEKTFVNQTGLGIALDDTTNDAKIEQIVKMARDYELERVGETLKLDAVSVTCKSGKPAQFAATLTRIAAIWDRAIIARSDDPAILEVAAETLKGRKCLLASATLQTADRLATVAVATGAAVVAAADNFDDLIATVKALEEKNLRDIFLELRADSLSEHFQNNTIIRRAALKSGVKSLGYPIIKYIATGNALDDALEAGLEIVKYGGLVIVPEFDPALLTPLLTLRQNIYTDPQQPLRMDPGIYAIGEPDASSPLLVTTNFSLTYFTVSTELESVGLP